MKFSVLLRILKPYTLSLMAVLALLCPKMSLASENDPYTYSYIQLEDSKDKLNLKLNQLFDLVFTKINQNILKGKKYTDTDVEWYFSYYYFNEMFNKDVFKDAFSIFETCIDTNSCENWPYFERIAIYLKESVYHEADYSRITKKYMATNIDLCGVRMGTDKISHLLKDGFKLYNATKDSDYKLTDQDIYEYSVIYENRVMGAKNTGVFSRADIYANIKGAQFFKDLFVKNVIIMKNGLIGFKPVDICQYIDKKFDERYLKNIFTESPEKVKRLMSVIEKRQNDKSQPITKNELLHRKLPMNFVLDTDVRLVGMRNAFEPFKSLQAWHAFQMLDLEPIYQKRLVTHIPHQK